RNLYYLPQNPLTPTLPISISPAPQSLIPMHWLEIASTTFPKRIWPSWIAQTSPRGYSNHSAIPLHTDAESSPFEDAAAPERLRLCSVTVTLIATIRISSLGSWPTAIARQLAPIGTSQSTWALIRKAPWKDRKTRSSTGFALGFKEG